ncbi:hypothetical protein CRENBAI_002187 [Crenichthys baileyi]|uniref:Uncharacterized protein n=1 Tax=Crenichthys baileyi TaxID=28760 RepID=A0AAV9RVI7_9TELE
MTVTVGRDGRFSSAGTGGAEERAPAFSIIYILRSCDQPQPERCAQISTKPSVRALGGNVALHILPTLHSITSLISDVRPAK